MSPAPRLRPVKQLSSTWAEVLNAFDETINILSRPQGRLLGPPAASASATLRGQAVPPGERKPRAWKRRCSPAFLRRLDNFLLRGFLFRIAARRAGPALQLPLPFALIHPRFGTATRRGGSRRRRGVAKSLFGNSRNSNPSAKPVVKVFHNHANRQPRGFFYPPNALKFSEISGIIN